MKKKCISIEDFHHRRLAFLAHLKANCLYSPFNFIFTLLMKTSVFPIMSFYCRQKFVVPNVQNQNSAKSVTVFIGNTAGKGVGKLTNEK